MLQNCTSSIRDAKYDFEMFHGRNLPIRDVQDTFWEALWMRFINQRRSRCFWHASEMLWGALERFQWCHGRVSGPINGHQMPLNRQSLATDDGRPHYSAIRNNAAITVNVRRLPSHVHHQIYSHISDRKKKEKKERERERGKRGSRDHDEVTW